MAEQTFVGIVTSTNEKGVRLDTTSETWHNKSKLGAAADIVLPAKGSHVKLVRDLTEAHQVLTIPLHAELDPGTLRAIFRQASGFISEQDLRPHFYT